MNKEYAHVFEGDGRQMVEPKEEWDMPGHPIPIRRQQAREIGRLFDAAGVSVHSEMAYTLWVAIAWAQYHEFGTVLMHDEGVGFSLRKTN